MKESAPPENDVLGDWQVSTPTGYYDLPEVGPTVEDCDMVRPSPKPPVRARVPHAEPPRHRADHHRDGAERRRAEHAGLRDEPGDGPEPAPDPRLRQPLINLLILYAVWCIKRCIIR